VDAESGLEQLAWLADIGLIGVVLERPACGLSRM